MFKEFKKQISNYKLFISATHQRHKTCTVGLRSQMALNDTSQFGYSSVVTVTLVVHHYTLTSTDVMSYYQIGVSFFFCIIVVMFQGKFYEIHFSFLQCVGTLQQGKKRVKKPYCTQKFNKPIIPVFTLGQETTASGGHHRRHRCIS